MVNSVTGPVDGSDLGIVAVREHLAFGLPGWDLDPFLAWDRPSAFAAAVNALKTFKELGGGTIVEAGGTGLGPGPDTLERLSRASGVKIVATSGLARQDLRPPHFSGVSWMPDREALAEMMAGALRDGLPASGMVRSKLRAGAVIAGTSHEGMRPAEEEAIAAAARAARTAEAPVFAGGAGHGERIFELLTSEGLAPDRIVIGHCDDVRVADPARDAKLAGRGAYVAFDHIGWEDGSAAHAMPDARRIEAIKALVAAGLVERIVLSCSAIVSGQGVAASGHSIAHLLQAFVPQLRQARIADGDIRTMLVDNPARLFSTGGRS